MKVLLSFLLFIFLFSSSANSSELITWNFTARVSQKIGPLPELSIGDNITGSVTFIGGTKNRTLDSATEANYRAIDNIRLRINNEELISKNKDIGFPNISKNADG